MYIQVRGTEPRLTNVTVDGITLPAPEPTVRQVRLDVIPSDLVDSVEINKTLSANMDANGIGGSVNLRTKTAGEQPTFNLYTNGGYTPILTAAHADEFGGTYRAALRQATRSSACCIGGILRLQRPRHRQHPAGPRSATPLSRSRFTTTTRFASIATIAIAIGFDGERRLQNERQHQLLRHGLYSDLKDWGDKWYYEPVSNPLPSTGGTPATKLQAPKFYTSSKRPNASIGSLILNGRHFNNNSWITATLSASRSYEVDSAGNPKSDFSWNAAKLNCNFVPANQTDVYRPTFGACDQSRLAA